MHRGRKILAVVPARGGSKGVPLKNIHPLMGKPLIAHVGAIIDQLKFIDQAVVSTDHEKIAAAAVESGLTAPFRRPTEISGDRIGDLPVLSHALKEMEKIDNVEYDIVLMLQPTCPLRRARHVDTTVRQLIEGGWDAVWTVSRVDSKYHPYKHLVRATDGGLKLYDSEAPVNPTRQELGETFIRNGACYALTRDCLSKQKTTLGSRSCGVVIEEDLVSIDTLEDFKLVERLMMERRE